MLKFVVLPTISLTAISNTIGETGLPPLGLECLENFRNIWPDVHKMELECTEKNKFEGEFDYKGYYECKDGWIASNSDYQDYAAKCKYIDLDYSSAQRAKFHRRLDEILQES